MIQTFMDMRISLLEGGAGISAAASRCSKGACGVTDEPLFARLRLVERKEKQTMKNMRLGTQARGLLLAMLAIGLLAAMPLGAQTWIELHPAGGPSGGILTRQPVGLGYDAGNNRLIVFFASNPLLGHPDPEAWVLTNANGLGGAPSWIQLQPSGTPPPANNSPGVGYDELENRLIVYGGCRGNCSPALSDVRVLTHANGLGGAPAWEVSTVLNPQPRADPGVVLDAANNRLIAFGGNFAFFGTARNDTRVLINANGRLGSSSWQSLVTAGPLPPIRSGGTVVYDQATNRLVVFGGFDLSNVRYNDTWVLSNANGLTGVPTWIPLAPAGTLPLKRILASAVYDPMDNRMLLFGGLAESNPPPAPFVRVGDLWELSHANGSGGAPTWKQLRQRGDVPGPTHAQRAVFDEVSRRVILFGGVDSSGGHARIRVLTFTDPVVIDIKPGSDPNSINLRSRGLVPVALLSTSVAAGDDFDLDATTIDPQSVRMGPSRAGIAHSQGHIEDVDGDGDLDLVVHFRAEGAGIVCGDTEATVEGRTISGQAVEGQDRIRLVGCPE